MLFWNAYSFLVADKNCQNYFFQKVCPDEIQLSQCNQDGVFGRALPDVLEHLHVHGLVPMHRATNILLSTHGIRLWSQLISEVHSFIQYFSCICTFNFSLKSPLFPYSMYTGIVVRKLAFVLIVLMLYVPVNNFSHVRTISCLCLPGLKQY